MRKFIGIALAGLLMIAGCAGSGTSSTAEILATSEVLSSSEMPETLQPSAITDVSTVSGASAFSEVSEVSIVSIPSEVSEVSAVSETTSEIGPGDTIVIENAIVFFRDDTLAKAVTNTGKVIYIRQPDDWLTPGCEINDKLARCESDGALYVVNEINSVTLANYNPLTATREEAPGMFCRFYFASNLFSGKWDALSDFSIKNITILDGGNEHLIRFRVQYTVTPARYASAFSWYILFFHEYGSMKPSEEMTAEVTLVGADGLWMPVRDTLPEIHDLRYSDREPYANHLYVNGLLNVVFETENYTYFTETHLVVDENGKCEEAKTLTTVFAFRNSDKRVISLIVDIEDTTVWFVDWPGDKVVFGSTWLPPESEPDSGSIYIIDESTLTYQEIPNRTCDAVCDQGFFYTDKYDGDHEAVLHFYDYASGKITAYPEAEVYYIGEEDYMDFDFQFCYYQGNVIWNNGKTWLALNQATGKVSEYVWK